VKSRQQLEKERDDMVKQTIMQYKKESSQMSERVKQEETIRQQFLLDEKERIEKEERSRQEALLRAEEERAKKNKEQQEKMQAMEIEKRNRQEAEKKKIEEKKRISEQQAFAQRQQAEQQRKQEEEAKKREMKQKEDARLQQLKKQEELEIKRKIKQEQESMTKVNLRGVSASPHVTRRSDDMHGQGFGQVRTGHVVSTKISFLNRASSAEPEISPTESPAPRKRIVRFQGLDSPGNSPVPRPWIKTGEVAANVKGWTEKVTEYEKEVARQSPIPSKSVLKNFTSQRRAMSESRSVSSSSTATTTISFRGGRSTPSPPLPPPPPSIAAMTTEGGSISSLMSF